MAETSEQARPAAKRVTVESVPTVVIRSYLANTDHTLKIIDCFLVYFAMVASVQFVYCALVTSFPFNSFLAGFLSSVGMFVLTVSLRTQINPENKATFGGKAVSKERAFADWVLCNVVLHVVVFNFVG